MLSPVSFSGFQAFCPNDSEPASNRLEVLGLFRDLPDFL